MDRQSQRRLHQRAYRFRKQQHASEIEADRDQYCKAASQLEKELLSTTDKIDSLFTILQEMEQVFSSNNLQMQDRMKEQLKDLKKCGQRRQSLTEPTQLSARQLKPRDANDSASPDNESHAADTRETVSRNNQQSTHRNPYIPQHTALYYLQTQALLKQSEQAASKGKNALDPTFLEIALKMNDQENVNFKCLPSQSLRERILLFQDIVDVTKVVNQIIKGVLLKLKPGVTEDQAQAIQDSIIDLPNIIPGVLKSSVGKDFGGRSKGFDIAWVFEFVDREALEVYNKHPAHLKFIEKHGVHREDILINDYEF
ncbi:hypothetical protein Unana1_08796 [Umbelopsis nana]